jgi:hypothetical protein
VRGRRFPGHLPTGRPLAGLWLLLLWLAWPQVAGASLEAEAFRLLPQRLLAEAAVKPQLEDGLAYREPAVPPRFAGRKTVFLPIPMIGTSPNKGVDIGILPVWLFFKEGCIRYILAPSVDYNTEQGLILSGRLFSYPAPCCKWFVIAERSIEVRQNYEAFLEDYRLGGGDYYLRAWGWFQDDPTAVFFGFGPQSRKENESRYNLREGYGEVFFGWNVAPWRFLLSERLRFALVQNRGFDQPEFTGEVFPDVPGLGGSFNATHGVAIVFDDRDHPDVPSCGRFGQLWGEASVSPLSDYDFFRYGIEWRHYIPWPSDRFITAYQILYTAVSDSDIPFYEQPALGGQDFRGFPESRFVGRGKIQLNLEERIRAARLRMLGVDFDVEVAPFVALGQVFEDEADALSDLQPIGGIGFRAVVRPQVVGKVDIGYGGEGMNIFVSLNYPF